jgi:hypothetical protein
MVDAFNSLMQQFPICWVPLGLAFIGFAIFVKKVA